MSIDLQSPPTMLPPLVNGEHLSREEFERRYEAMPDVRAELLEGVVYLMSSPVSRFHGSPHADIIGWLVFYRSQTPGCLVDDNVTFRLDSRNEPQPDAMLTVAEEFGGTARTDADGFVEGSPELIVEIAVTSVRTDARIKKPIYQRNGVKEYLIWRVEDHQIDWFILRNNQYEILPSGEDGILRSEAFPGLWLDPAAMIALDIARTLQVLARGLASPDHANFVQQLEQQRSARQQP